MISAEDAVVLAIAELMRAGKRPYAHNVPNEAAKLLSRSSAGTITVEEAFQQVKMAIATLSESKRIEASLDPKVTWKVNESAYEIIRSIRSKE